ncbi:GH-E family nuclease [Kitasatospora sp. NPDC005856]|uniref:GH-E family nuclease n=1 Tax=Kitasatospora sp. NPDC005856 TaxID=3154566 RepID=UPI0033F0BDDD
MAAPAAPAAPLQRAAASAGPAAAPGRLDEVPVQRWYAGEPLPRTVRDVDIQPDNTIDPAVVAAFVDQLDRRQLGWYEHDTDENRDTRALVIRNTRQVVSEDPFSGRAMVLYQCGLCHNATTYAGIDIGHIVDWKRYLKQKGVTDLEEAKAAYNDLDNLRVECATCNRSHDFEGNSETDDSGSDLDSFVEDDTAMNDG